MFITRATRREMSQVKEFYDAHDWYDDADRGWIGDGVAFVARQGPIVGCLRLVEVSPQTLVVEDVLVAPERRGSGIGTQLMQALMNSRGGSLHLCCHDDRIPFYQRLGFSEVGFDDLPEPVQERMRLVGDHPTPPGHVHHFLRAR
jgi:GNAT superfamily N-acetyltransferase